MECHLLLYVIAQIVSELDGLVALAKQELQKKDLGEPSGQAKIKKIF
jgi:hypothetical protein